MKQNRKLRAKFFRLFQVIHPVEKPVYKLELSKKRKIHDIFHVLLLEQDSTKKEWVDKNDITKLDTDKDESGGYELEAICNSAIHPRKSKSGHLLKL